MPAATAPPNEAGAGPACRSKGRRGHRWLRRRELDLVVLDQALEELAELDPGKARVVELRFFGGLSLEETAETLGVSPSTVGREWRMARAWLRRSIVAEDAGRRAKSPRRGRATEPRDSLDGRPAQGAAESRPSAWRPSAGSGSNSLFQAALDLPPADRAAYLREACEGDAALRREVESLIDRTSSAGSFIEEPLCPGPRRSLTRRTRWALSRGRERWPPAGSSGATG